MISMIRETIAAKTNRQAKELALGLVWAATLTDQVS